MVETICRTSAVGHTWKEVEKDFFTEEELIKDDFKVSILSEIVKLKMNKNISESELQDLNSFLKKVDDDDDDVISAKEILDFLVPRGLTLAIVPIQKDTEQKQVVTAQVTQTASVSSQKTSIFV